MKFIFLAVFSVSSIAGMAVDRVDHGASGTVDQCRFSAAAAKNSVAWDTLNEDQRYKDAIPYGFRVVDTDLACARRERKLARRATYVAQFLLQATFIGIDSFQVRDVATMKAVARKYLPVAVRYRRVPNIDRLTASYLEKCIRYFKEFAIGRCSLSSCRAREPD